MTKIGNILLIGALTMVGLLVAGAVLLCIIQGFHLTGPPWDFIRSSVDWNWFEKYQGFVAGSIGASLLFTAAILTILQLRAARRISYADLVVRLAMDWNSKEFVDSRRRILEVAPIEVSGKEQRSRLKAQFLKAQKDSLEDYFTLTKPLDFFEELAFLIRKDYIPIEHVSRTFGEPMIVYYEIFKDCIDEMRSIPENKTAYRELEEVVKQLKKRMPSQKLQEVSEDN